MYALYSQDCFFGGSAQCKVLVTDNSGQITKIYDLEPSLTGAPFVWGLFTPGCVHLAQRILLDCFEEISVATRFETIFSDEVLANIPMECSLRLISSEDIKQYVTSLQLRGM
jgi:hypothetical protein